MFRSKYFTTGLGIYMSYFMLGMALILLSSNMEFVINQLNTDVAGITFLISIEGLDEFNNISSTFTNTSLQVIKSLFLFYYTWIFSK